MSSRVISENSLTLPPVDVIYTDPETRQLMALRVRTKIKDRSAYEVHAHKNGWPTERPMTTAMFLWSGFLAWSALRRDPNAPACLKTPSPDAFIDFIEDVQLVTDEDEADQLDPTQGEAGHDGD